MPTVLRIGPYRVFFFAADRFEPPHVHVRRGDSVAKVWLNPPEVAWHLGFRQRELNRILQLVEAHQEILEGHWHDFFAD